MVNLCKHKNIFGKVGEGAHKLHLGGVAIVDFMLTVLGAFIFYYISGVPMNITLIVLLVLAIILHKVFCVNTSSNLFLFR